jgi:hypothetical protein
MFLKVLNIALIDNPQELSHDLVIWIAILILVKQMFLEMVDIALIYPQELSYHFASDLPAAYSGL